MRKISSSHEANDLDLYKAVEKVYRERSTELPDSEIDRQILAAARRELSEPNKRKSFLMPWWKRLALPVYVAVTFTFTAIAAHWFWPAPVKVPPGTSPGPVTIDIMNSDAKVPPKQKRKERKLPKTEFLQQLPVLPKTQIQKAEDMPLLEKTDFGKKELTRSVSQKPKLNTGQKNSQKEQSDPPEKASSGNHMSKLDYPEKEVWARTIIEMLKKGEYENARKELIRFKKIYPGYPIDEQIEALR